MAVEKFIRESDVERLCECDSRKCGPHRCTPSKWLAGGVVVLLLYAIFMHSFSIGAQEALREDFATNLTETVDIHVASAFASTIQANDAYLDRVQELVRRADSWYWAVSTPDVERDLQLKQQLDALPRQ